MTFIHLYVLIVWLCLGASKKDNSNLPACRLLQQSSDGAVGRIVVIGDIHGSHRGLREILLAAQVIDSLESCTWSKKIANAATILVQMGDLVDRGDEASEAWQCLDELHATLPAAEHDKNKGSKLVRIIGNHEVWWLENKFHMRNAAADTKAKVLQLVRQMKAQIISSELTGAFAININSVPLLFVHAGYRATYLAASPIRLAADLAEHFNGVLVDAMQHCSEDWVACPFDDYGELFQAGPERGGSNLGGPVWTDFRVLAKDDKLNGLSHNPNEYIQIVGHSAASCDDGDDTNGYPDMAHCGQLIRATDDVEAVCVDGGMYQGTRSFLEINITTGSMLAHEKDPQGTEWLARQINGVELCGS